MREASAITLLGSVANLLDVADRMAAGIADRIARDVERGAEDGMSPAKLRQRLAKASAGLLAAAVAPEEIGQAFARGRSPCGERQISE
ncbi:hypothetical protein Q4F19_17550 [Sphingomonas sp. BIUV-7]|uniref:Uncharacterized protein n=1 Tax=Sphingomonas natans TaxID=3063330 RepID=A0ABT8YCV6_9SPHN|nr:hypothetical protein [Sphingomonas sp. BIUV-7]MDO6416196.1 hypothetical protein [Sphingomonas sp. BIUV-7]